LGRERLLVAANDPRIGKRHGHAWHHGTGGVRDGAANGANTLRACEDRQGQPECERHETRTKKGVAAHRPPPKPSREGWLPKFKHSIVTFARGSTVGSTSGQGWILKPLGVSGVQVAGDGPL